jgi:ACS family hexuronate transporter-like MFS transporter
MVQPLDATPGAGRMTRVRWFILALIFFGTTTNYLDRMVMGILAPDLQRLYHITDSQYGNIQSAFAFAYACGQLISGGILDRIGIRMGYAMALTAWSIVSMLHAVARGPVGFGVVRALLGLSESPAFPGATKALAEWFPKHERALAFGFINAGTNMGAILAPALVPWLASTYGWQWAFIGTALAGFVCLGLWMQFYRKPSDHRLVSALELAHINSDPPDPPVKVRWLTLFTYRQAWAFAVAKFLTDSMWWFYMMWFPKFLYKQHKLDLLHIGMPLIIIYLMSDAGSIAGGWLSSSLLKRGATVNRARKTALVVCALAVTPVIFAQSISSLTLSVLVLGLATAAHQGFSTNLFTIVSDMFPRQMVASVAGLGGMCGYFGASLFQILVGHVVEKQNNYLIPFVCAGLAYLIAFGLIHLLAPRLEPALIKSKSANSTV